MRGMLAACCRRLKNANVLCRHACCSCIPLQTAAFARTNADEGLRYLIYKAEVGGRCSSRVLGCPAAPCVVVAHVIETPCTQLVFLPWFIDELESTLPLWLT